MRGRCSALGACPLKCAADLVDRPDTDTSPPAARLLFLARYEARISLQDLSSDLLLQATSYEAVEDMEIARLGPWSHPRSRATHLHARSCIR